MVMQNSKVSAIDGINGRDNPVRDVADVSVGGTPISHVFRARLSHQDGLTSNVGAYRITTRSAMVARISWTTVSTAFSGVTSPLQAAVRPFHTSWS